MWSDPKIIDVATGKPPPPERSGYLTRETVLSAADAATSGDRDHDYGSPENNFKQIAELLNAAGYRKRSAIVSDRVSVLDATDIALIMSLLKIARLLAQPGHADSWVDLAGYSACGGELATGGAQ